ncbi:MAG: thiamine biosynthesis protein ThiS [Hydrogenophilales bacterium 28-61-23]|nr:MAG: thiamine biosynthesis protein ThiS [Hydrogenophilales bacterium 28-61-23]
MINLFINGQQRQFSATLSITQLLQELDLTGKRVAIELNGEIVPRSAHAVVTLSDADHLEIVVAVGGG